MCVKAEGFNFAHGFKIQVSLEKSYRILLAENIKENLINGCYGICLENGFFAISKEPKPLAMQQIIYDILNQSLNVEEFNRRKFPGKEISYAEAITGNISDKLNNYIRERR